MTRLTREHLKRGLLTLLVLLAAAGWLLVWYYQHRSEDPLEVVRKHFVFYPEYSHGLWQEKSCMPSSGEKCHEVFYTVPIKGCGPITFDWRVFLEDDAEASWSYKGANPKLDETKYPLYAVLNEDSRLIDSPALGKPFPESCQLK